MNKYNKIYGIDISKDVFDSFSSCGNHALHNNDAKGFSKFAKKLNPDDLIVMESTGYYHFRLAQYLSKKGYNCAVVNPLSVKRFIQMKLAKVKTDKADAKAICVYAQANAVSIYDPLDDTQSECLQLFSILQYYQKQLTAIKNKLHGEAILGRPSKAVYHSLNRTKKHLQKEIKTIRR